MGRAVVHLGPGTSEHIRRLARDQARRGHRVTILADSAHGPFAPLEGVAYATYDGARRLPYRVRRILGVLREARADVLHSHYLNIGGFLGAFSGFHPHLMHGWGSDVFLAPHYSALQNLKTRMALRSADYVLTPSTVMRDALNRLGLGLARNEALPWGIDTDHFAPNPAAAGAFRARLGLGDGLVVFSPRALQPLYHQDKLIEAWNIVNQRLPGARLLVSRYGADAAFEAALRRRIDTLGLADQVRWVDPLAYDELPAAYAAADVVVSIPRSDAPAITVLEAMACARPVAVSDLPALHEIIREGVNGVLVDVHDPAAIANGLLTLLQTAPAHRMSIGETNRAYVLAHARRETTLARLDAIYAAFAPPGVRPARTLRNLMGLA